MRAASRGIIRDAPPMLVRPLDDELPRSFEGLGPLGVERSAFRRF
jgi:hypothetical protein